MFEQYENARLPIETTPSGIMVFLQPATSLFVLVLIMALQLFLESNVELSSSTVITAKFSQPANGFSKK